jgi:hypothetical protein
MVFSFGDGNAVEIARLLSAILERSFSRLGKSERIYDVFTFVPSCVCVISGRFWPPHAFLTISKPRSANSFRILFARWEHSSGLIQVALLQSGSSSLEYAVKAARIPASIALVASSDMRVSTTSRVRCVTCYDFRLRMK